MDQQNLSDPNNQLPDDPTSEVQKDQSPSSKSKRVNSFSFWRGLSTALGAAVIVATLFTFWTPGSLVESGLEARMAQAVELASSDDSTNVLNVGDQTDSTDYLRIGIVAGHYGSDPGAVCQNGATEAELNLEIATLVQKNLADRGYEVDLLEEFDTRLWGYKGAVVLSIHLDSCEYINDQATGYKVAAALSAQNVTGSQRLTRCLSERYGETTGLPYHAGSVTDDMTYYHAFSEIDPGTVAAIIEAGFLNMDYRFITEETDRIADGIAAGILCYLNEEPIQSNQNP